MSRTGIFLGLCSLLSMFFLLTSCTQDTYEKGEGTYSLMQADFVEAHTNSDKLIDQVITDDQQLLALQKPLTTQWVTTADTVYRAVLYYNKVEDGKAEAITCNRITVMPITPRDSIKDGIKTDPVRMESVWMARSRRYLNASLYLKSGQTNDSTARHRMGIVGNKFVSHPDGTRTLHLQLYHDQGDVPQYYSQRAYFSIPLYALHADSVSLSIRTYDGVKSWQFCIK